MDEPPSSHGTGCILSRELSTPLLDALSTYSIANSILQWIHDGLSNHGFICSLFLFGINVHPNSKNHARVCHSSRHSQICHYAQHNRCHSPRDYLFSGFVYLGAHYAEITANVEPEFMLPTIAKHIMGESASLFIGIAMLFSCFTTAVALNNIYARYLHTLFGLSDKAFPRVLLATTSIAFLISLLDFKGIAAFLAPALEISYPGIIALTILGILSSQWLRLKKYVFYGISTLMAVGFFLKLLT